MPAPENESWPLVSSPWFIPAAAVVLLLLRTAIRRAARPLLRRATDDVFVLITGCDTGIGLLTVQELTRTTECGVVAACLTKEGAARCESAGAVAVVADLTVAADVRRLAATAQSSSGGLLSAIVHCAGAALCGPAELQAIDNYRRVMEVNLFSVAELTRLLLPCLKRQDDSRVVIVSSVDGIVSLPNNAPYDCSKHAVEAYAKCLRAETAVFGLTVSIVSPR